MRFFFCWCNHNDHMTHEWMNGSYQIYCFEKKNDDLNLNYLQYDQSIDPIDCIDWCGNVNNNRYVLFVSDRYSKRKILPTNIVCVCVSPSDFVQVDGFLSIHEEIIEKLLLLEFTSINSYLILVTSSSPKLPPPDFFCCIRLQESKWPKNELNCTWSCRFDLHQSSLYHCE